MNLFEIITATIFILSIISIIQYHFKRKDYLDEIHFLRDDINSKIVSVAHYRKENARLQEIIRKMTKLEQMQRSYKK